MDTLGLLGCFDFDGFPNLGDIATDYIPDAMCWSTSVSPKRSGKLTLTSKTVNSAFFLVAMWLFGTTLTERFGGHGEAG